MLIHAGKRLPEIKQGYVVLRVQPETRPDFGKNVLDAEFRELCWDQ